ncbi:DUF7344 domain-containing protein [Halosimplex pelagicum]|uniref:DUF7344 domain-containing protein n=1 Tax=Halosimplex pelagicum TaxID=869886 RepID=A0A7D5TUM3_9EURY|nr:hypothetical protein [Halosimplex pelagicum]QLH82438.1 hypothetical protein HZS54_12790 [Halosimplex pelagicum]QLH82494.1 hypothetical protein HZS54_13095 [Halosimplex pelagicum]
MFGLDLFGADADETDDPEPEADPVTADVPPGDLFEALRSDRRRLAIRWVNQLDAVDMVDLAETVACEEYDCTIANLTDQQRKRVYVSLYQTHVPKLDQLDIVDIGDDQEVHATPATEAAMELLATGVEVTGGNR